MKSCIYTGHIRHRRFKPTTNAFRYRICTMFLDLNELPTLFDECALWSYESPNLASWRRRHYLGPRDLSLREAIRFRIEDAGFEDPGGPVRMLTQPGYFGYCYNPVSFYYCYDAEDKDVRIIIAEINNTPWDERHAYVLADRIDESDVPGKKRFKFDKIFHVSPFMPMSVKYDWRFTEPGESINIHMADVVEGEKHFDATLTLKRRELSCKNLNLMLVQYPLMTFKIVSGIYYQAFKLWLKKTPFYENPDRRPSDDRDYYATVKSSERHRDENADQLDR